MTGKGYKNREGKEDTYGGSLTRIRDSLWYAAVSEFRSTRVSTWVFRTQAQT